MENHDMNMLLVYIDCVFSICVIDDLIYLSLRLSLHVAYESINERAI